MNWSKNWDKIVFIIKLKSENAQNFINKKDDKIKR